MSQIVVPSSAVQVPSRVTVFTPPKPHHHQHPGDRALCELQQVVPGIVTSWIFMLLAVKGPAHTIPKDHRIHVAGNACQDGPGGTINRGCNPLRERSDGVRDTLAHRHELWVIDDLQVSWC